MELNVTKCSEHSHITKERIGAVNGLGRGQYRSYQGPADIWSDKISRHPTLSGTGVFRMFRFTNGKSITEPIWDHTGGAEVLM